MVLRLLIVSLLMAGVAARATQPSPAQRLDELLDADDEFARRAFPEFATMRGDHRYSRQWNEHTRAAYDADRAHSEEMLAALQQIDRTGLTDEQALQLELAQRDHQLTVDAARFGEYYLPVDQMRGAHLSIPTVIGAMPRRTVDDVELILARLAALPRLLEQWETALREGLTSGTTLPRAAIGEVPDQVLGQLAGVEPLRSPLMSPFSELPDSIAAPEQAAIRARAEQLLTRSVRPAYERFARFLKDEYIPNARSTDGYGALPNGDAWYLLELRRHATMTLSPSQVHQQALARVTQITAEMAEIRRELKFDGDADAFRATLDHEAHQYESVEELLRHYRDVAKRADTFLPRYFRVLPRMPFGIEPTPAFRGAAAASYRQPARDGSRAGIVFTGAPLSASRRWRTVSTALHEGMPGHHLERALNIEREAAGGRPRPPQTAYVEGWATYAEGLGQEMGLYSDPYVRYGNLIGEMIGVTGAAIDTGLHSQGWSRERATAFRQTHVGGQQSGYAVSRMSVWPGQILSYGIGADVIRGLRQELSSRFGSSFDIREFHDVVLRDGPLPLDVLQRRVRAYYAKK